MKSNYSVRPIESDVAVPWFEAIHYAHRVPSISYCFGLFKETELLGVVSYGTPASSTLLSGVCGQEHADKVIELNRLVIKEGAEKNCASLLVGRSLRLLPKPKIVVSYADTSQGHVGKIYQACNFLYTGLSSKFTDPKVKGLEHQHHATYAHGKTNDELRAEYGDRLYFVERARKHRYIYLAGCPELKQKISYPLLPYPKGESRRYEVIGSLSTTNALF